MTLAIDLKQDQQNEGVDERTQAIEFGGDTGGSEVELAREEKNTNISDGVPPAPARLPPKMTLDEFCKLYQISNAAKEKLVRFKVAGPHALRFLSDDVLKATAFLHPAETADWRDSHERWIHGIDP
ncbi:hypothetical protein BDV98DRAFT_605312 [Pterulicium gracile]|uniref:Uncharacterized protein n=1 Tax=Pterulicium gracile TaxID=1884261 RepID=A0A5C3QHS5_9AGAR|nr:hypothetical protein BDV98DRAFT_605312 [Pterula gracilis]